MKSLIFVVFAILLCNCSGPSQVTLTYYNSNSPEEQQLFIDSANKFNQLVGCEAVKLKHVDTDRTAKFEDGVQEIQIIESADFQLIAAKTAAAHEVDSVAALTFVADGDVVLARDDLTTECYYMYDNKCVYNKGEIFFFHELGHVFGLLHDEKESDIMAKAVSGKHTMYDFIDFINRLHQQTNVCKGVK